MKTDKEHFIDWEGETFGFGYGTGEGHIIPALRQFLLLCEETPFGSYSYGHEPIERELTPTVAWLLLNILCRVHVIEYGGSPRYGWLTKEGKALRDFCLSKSDDELIDIVTNSDIEYVNCYNDHCNCDGEECHNPFWENAPNKTRATFVYD